MQTRIFHLHALSPVHVGIGQAVGTVDLPIARERATNLPLIPGSALKGVLRDEFAADPAAQKTLFGPDSLGDGAAHAGAVAFGDAWLLALPVRALVGTVCFATAPFLLSRYRQAATRCGLPDLPAIPELEEDQAAVPSGSRLLHKETLVLEDLDLGSRAMPLADQWASVLGAAVRDESWRPHFAARFAILPDAVFGFLADTGTEVRTRIRIDDKHGTVQHGALWYEENLPAESLLFGILGFDKARDGSTTDVQAAFAGRLGGEALIQIGGKATVGRGLVRFLA